MQKLTVKEALEQGYVYCGQKTNDWQSLTFIKDLDSTDFENELVLYSKESSSPTITADSLKDLIADHMESDWGSDTGDDTNQVYEKAITLDYAPFAEMINNAMSGIQSYAQTEIQLIP